MSRIVRNVLPALAAVAAAGLAAVPVQSQEAGSGGDFRAAFEQLKRLAGTWDTYRVDADARRPATISYHVTSGGSVVWEEFVGDQPDGVRDMATAYHLDVDELVATHYCGAGNQPRMRAASYDPESGTLRFTFWDITHQEHPDDYHTTDIVLVFEDDDNAELHFRGTEAGVRGDWQIRKMHRATTRAHERSGG